MRDRVFGILKHSAIYSIGNIAQKGMGVITLPIFTNPSFLAVSEYGAYALLDSTIAIIAEVLTLGQANSVIYFNNKNGFEDKKKSVFFTISTLILIVNLFFVLLTGLFSGTVLKFFGSSGQYDKLIPTLIIIIFARALNNVFMNKLRADEKSILYTIIVILKIVSFVATVFFTVIHLKLSVTGIMIAYVISEVFVLLIQLPGAIKTMSFSFDRQIAVDAFKFGFPLIFSTIGIMILNLSDRYLIKYYLSLKEVGVYDFGYRIAGVVNMFLIMPFSSALLPSTFKVYGKSGDKRYYSKLMTYMFFITLWGGLAISIFSSELILFFSNKNYLGARYIIPIIILAYVFSGARAVASTGLMVEKKTIHIGTITIAAGILNVLLNIFLIPLYGSIAAAYTTLASFILFYYVTKISSNKYYRIPFEETKMLLLIIVGTILFFLSENIPTTNIFVRIPIKLCIIALFPFLLIPLRFYENIELVTIKNTLQKLSSLSDFKKILTNLLDK